MFLTTYVFQKMAFERREFGEGASGILWIEWHELKSFEKNQRCSTGGTKAPQLVAILMRMNFSLTAGSMRIVPMFAQVGGLVDGTSKAMGIVMLIGFIFGTICVVSGGFAIRRGDTDSGKLSIIGGLIIAGAPAIVKALFTAFGLGGSTVDIGAF